MRTVVGPGELGLVRDLLLRWPEVPEPPADASTPVRRLIGAARAGASVGTGDLAVLLRQVLRAADEIGDAGNLKIPTEHPWPEEDQLEIHGLTSAPTASGWRSIVAREWRPEWIGEGKADPTKAVLRGQWETPRSISAVRSDPFFEQLTGFATYRSPGQREAIRALLTGRPDASVIAALPTGSGKSVVAYLYALAPAGEGCTVVVVPTVSLALDQERAFLELLVRIGRQSEHPQQLAYYSELDEITREAIRDRIRTGAQRIVFTSPEAAVQSLSPALFDAAGAGRLRLFAIDEAHIVSEWGADFRPAFQAVGALRRALQEAQRHERPFRTLLLSGTLTDDGIATLGRLFGEQNQHPLVVAGIDLRAEPGYWVSSAPTVAERSEWVMDAVRHLPRPLILYTTKIDHAKQWRDRLVASGYQRCELVIGETSATARRVVIDRLSHGEADVVVATSAFGLGVDQPDVRCIVHACLPETLNRWYQEVGRGGRDGHPSLALLVTTRADGPIARSLASTRLISLQRGRDRWVAMISRAESLGGDRFRLPLFASPPDIKGDNDENRRWNLRLLLLMDRAGLLRLEQTPPPQLGEDASDEEWEAAFDEHAKHATITLLHGGLADDRPWDDHFAPARDAALTADRSAHTRMHQALDTNRRLCELFAETYTIDDPRGDGRIRPAPTCATCPGCRAAPNIQPPNFYPQHRPQPVRGTGAQWDSELLKRFAGHYALVLHYQADAWPSRVQQASVRLAELGMRSAYGPSDLRSWDELRRVRGGDRAVFIDELDWRRRDAPDVPTAVVHPPGHAPQRAELADTGPSRVILVCSNVRHPDHSSLCVHEYAPSSLALERFMADF